MAKKTKESAETENDTSKENGTPGTPESEVSLPEKKSEAPELSKANQEAAPIGADELAGPLAENMPEPTSADVQGIKLEVDEEDGSINSDPKNPPLTSGYRDKSNRVFNPDKHRSNPDGTPKFNKNGFFLSKDAGRPPGSTKSSSAEGGKEKQPESLRYFNTTGIPDEYDKAAELYLSVGFGLLATYFTNDIKPENIEEQGSLTIPLAAVLREKGMIDLTPTQLFMIALGSHIAKKSSKPTVKEKMTLLYLRIRSFFVKEKMTRETADIKETEARKAA